MEAAEKILAGVPAPSRRTFLRAVVVMEFIFSTAFSTSNIVKGAVATGSITDGGGHCTVMVPVMHAFSTIVRSLKSIVM